MQRIYFDHNANSPLHPKVLEKIASLNNMPLNPSASHYEGREAKRLLEESRLFIKKTLGITETHEIIFTSSCTESNNLVLKNFPNHHKICSTIEHSSILEVIGEGIVPVNHKGVVDLAFIESECQKGQTLISISYAHGEIGVIQPIQEISKISKSYNSLLHIDITQAIAKTKLKIVEADLITFGLHKIGGPLGLGALAFKKGLDLKPLIQGGGQEFRLRSGTENLHSILAAKCTLELLDEISLLFQKTINVILYLKDRMKTICQESILIPSEKDQLPNTCLIYMPNVKSDVQLMYFDINGVAVSIGSACSSGRISIPKAYLALDIPREIAECIIRVSFGPKNTKKEVDKFIKIWTELFVKNNN